MRREPSRGGKRAVAPLFTFIRSAKDRLLSELRSIVEFVERETSTLERD